MAGIAVLIRTRGASPKQETKILFLQFGIPMYVQ